MKLSEVCDKFFSSNEIKQCNPIDCMCLRNALNRFIESGSKDDAFDVYFCFCEIYKVFGEGYSGNSMNLINIMSDHESMAGRLSDKQRDHYAHAVYVFALGVAIYQLNMNLQAKFKNADDFLHKWGLCALFHDIGYPFEVAFNSIKEYTQKMFGAMEPRLSYTQINEYTALSPEAQKMLEAKTIHEVIARKIAAMLGLDSKCVLAELDNVIANSTKFMDHAYFSCMTMFKKFLETSRTNADELQTNIEVCASIYLHSFFYRLVRGEKRIDINNPLAFLLILCDELQAFDREGYGKVSKSEPLPWTCELESKNNEITVTFVYNIGTDNGYIANHTAKAQSDIDGLLSFDGFGRIKIGKAVAKNPRQVFHTSASFYKNILNIAIHVHDNYLKSKTFDKLEADWNALSLELKMSNIRQAKSYAEKLNTLGYFYDDRQLLLDRVDTFSNAQIEQLACMEHQRWCDEKTEMRWKLGDKTDRATRVHCCLIPYDKLSENDKEKDKDTIRNMISVLQCAGLQVYKR